MPDKHEVGGSSPLGPTTYLNGKTMEKQQIPNNIWGCSSVGRAPALQAGGHGFESHHLHQAILWIAMKFLLRKREIRKRMKSAGQMKFLLRKS